MAEWDVDVLPATSYLNRAHKLAPLCGLMFKSSAGHHPLLAGALGAPHVSNWPACLEQRRHCLNFEGGNALSFVLLCAVCVVTNCTNRNLGQQQQQRSLLRCVWQAS